MNGDQLRGSWLLITIANQLPQPIKAPHRWEGNRALSKTVKAREMEAISPQ